MFIQDFQNGKVYRNLTTMQYVLKIDGEEFYGNTITEILKQYSHNQYKKATKKK